MHPILELIVLIVDMAKIALFVWIVLRLLIQFEVVNRFNPVISQVNLSLTRLFDPLLQPIRKRLPDLGGIDLSPMVLILALFFFERMIAYYLA